MGTQDEATFGLIPIIQRGWAKRGSNPTVNIAQSNKYTNVFAARSKRSFVFSFRKNKKQKDFVAFLEKLRKRWGKTLLFVDNARAHRGKLVNEFLNQHKKTFKLEYFLAYTPELNRLSDNS